MAVQKVIYEVTCPQDEKHVFEKLFEVEKGTEHLETEVEVYCPQCDDRVTATVKGRLAPNAEILRRFKQNH